MSAMQWFIPTVLLIGMLVAMWFAATQVRKRTGIGTGTVGPNALPVVGKRMLDQRKGLYIVQVADRYLLLGTSENSVGLIDRITAEEFEAMAGPVSDVKPLRKLRIARGATADTATDESTTDSEDDEELAATGTDPQFATVGEAFGLLLEKARGSARRTGRTTENTSK